MENIYYVYAYINAKTGLPYYIGKGKDDRAYAPHGHINLPPNKSNIIFMEKNLTNVGALALEKRYISWYGRKGLDKNGILLNRSIGGDSGPVGVKFSDETNKAKGRPGVKRPDHAEKMRQAWKEGKLKGLGQGLPHTEETKIKLRQPRKNKEGFQNKRWWRSPSLNLEICTNKKPDWPDTELGRIWKAKRGD